MGLAFYHQSAFTHTSLFARRQIFRSDDRGDTWRSVSGQLVARSGSRISCRSWARSGAWTRSPRINRRRFLATLQRWRIAEERGLIYVARRWTAADHRRRRQELAQSRKDRRRPRTRLRQRRIVTSNHRCETVYVAFENHQNADFKPYLFKSTDAGRTWTRSRATCRRTGPSGPSLKIM